MSSPCRSPRTFSASSLNILAVDDNTYSRSILMEVLRGIGIANDKVRFETTSRLIDGDIGVIQADVLLLMHSHEDPLDLHFVRHLRRLDATELAEIPIVLMSSVVTKTSIQDARDAGIDEIVKRPVAPAQLKAKIKQLVESPREFVSSVKYVGPCRRRRGYGDYTGVRRRLNDFAVKIGEKAADAKSVHDLTTAVLELRKACGALSEERASLIAHARAVADKTRALALETNDKPLERTAYAVRYYLDGVGSSNMIEPHVLETGINALTQLAVLPAAYESARQSIANLLMVAVRKKLTLYQNRKENKRTEAENLLDKINDHQTTEDPGGDDYEFENGPEDALAI